LRLCVLLMIVFQVQRIDVVSSCILFVFPVQFSKSVSTIQVLPSAVSRAHKLF